MSTFSKNSDATIAPNGLCLRANADSSQQTDKETGTAPTVPASAASTVDQEQGTCLLIALDTKTHNKKPRAKDLNADTSGRRSAENQTKGNRTDTPSPLSVDESQRLDELNQVILAAKTKESDGDTITRAAGMAMADALYEIQNRKLYRAEHRSFEQFASQRYHYARAHANRLAKFGEIRNRIAMSPRGDIIQMLASEKAARPLAKLSYGNQDQVLEILRRWLDWQKDGILTGSMVESAVTCHAPAKAPLRAEETKGGRREVAERSLQRLSGYLSVAHQKEGTEALADLSKLLAEVFGRERSTKIQWTNHTWNPLVGCSKASAGCDNCYAAKLAATILKKKFGHLVETSTATANGKKVTRHRFNGKLDLIPERLSEPLNNSEPTMYFVNSMSDLFHANVPEEFIESVFQTMEKAHWHVFQVLTKRPDRMAAFTEKYFHGRLPSENIWLGTSTENQKTFDDRLPHLLATKASVRWLSVEPLISRIQMTSLNGVDWVVVGGESGPNARRMEKPWAVEIRDQCAAENVPFFFKQWGTYREDGSRSKQSINEDVSGHAIGNDTLDEKLHHEFPKTPALGSVDEAAPTDAENNSEKAAV